MTKYLLPFSALLFLAGCPATEGGKSDASTSKDDECEKNPGACDEDGDGFLPSEDDCDDKDASVNPGSTEICDGIDNNCDGETDEGTTSTFYADVDADGFGDATTTTVACENPAGFVANGTDCNDAEPRSYPGNTEVCDKIDNNCDGEIDEGVANMYYADADADTFGDPTSGKYACEQPDGYVTDLTDCDDSTGSSFPGNDEVCDEIDNNCDGLVDEGVTDTYYADYDADGFGNTTLTQEACAQPTGYVSDATDCDDNASAVNPSAIEVCDTIDNNCDTVIDEDSAADALTWYADTDVDSFGNVAVTYLACNQPSGYVADATDCDDANGAVFPGATEMCNGIDDNCDEQIDEDTASDAGTWYLDADSDSFGNVTYTHVSCSAPAGYVADSTDCNDGTARAYPGATEYCDTIDNNCDSVVDEDSSVDAPTWYEDADVDAYGNLSVTKVQCYIPSGYVADNTDCDDARALTYPGAPEYCNTFDDNCDLTVDEDASLDASDWYADTDADAFGNLSSMLHQCYIPIGYVADSTDCDDTRAATYPGATEYCNMIDDDCDATVDNDYAVDAPTWYADTDSDTYGAVGTPQVTCYQPVGYVADSTDCNDGTSAAYPGATEVCDSIDNDCDGDIDEDGGVTGGTIYYSDTDVDGFGDAGDPIEACDLPPGYATNDYDCNDGEAGEPVVADSVLGSSSGAGTLTSPFDSIQDAVDASYECVVVYPGTYRESVDMSGKTIDLWGIDGADTTTIDANATVCTYVNATACETALRIDSGSGAQPTIHGFTVTGGSGAYTTSTASTTCADSSASHTGNTTCTVTTYDYCGGGIYINGDDPQISDMEVTANTLPDFIQQSTGSYTQTWMYSYGGGICVRDSLATFDNVDVNGNYADQGGGMYGGTSSNFTYEHGQINENDAEDGGGIYMNAASASFTNAAVLCNSAVVDGGGIFTEVSGTSTFVNTVFYRNTSAITGTTRGTDAWIGTSTTFVLYNSIVEANAVVASLYGAGSGMLEYNDVYNAAGDEYAGSFSAGTGSISVGTEVTSVRCDGNPANDNIVLRSTASGINTGNPASGYNDTDGSQNDMGGYGGPGGSW